MGISSAGIGSGLDINGLVNQLVAAEGQPVSARLDRQEAGAQAKLSAYGSLKGALSSFQGALGGLKTASAFQSRSATSSATNVLTATASTTAASGTYNVAVTNLAAAHTLASTASFSNQTDTVGTGTLTFKFGTTVYDPDTDTYTSFSQNANTVTKTVAIDASNNSLAGIRDAVNQADIGVSASIIYDGSNYRLVFVSESTGAEKSMEITVDDDDSSDTNTSGLSQLAFNAGATNLIQTASAQDAALTVNGIAINSASNTLTDAIYGVTLNLVAAGSSTVKVATNTGASTSAINSFVTAYNDLFKVIGSLSSYNADTQEAGVLLGDASVRGISNQLRRMAGTEVQGLGGNYTSLASIGITTDSKTGLLSLDSNRLQTALTSNFDDIAGLFSAYGTSTDTLVRYATSSSSTKAGNYAVNVTQLATQGQYTAAANSTLTVADGSNSFAIKVDGVQSAMFSLSAKTYASGTELAAEMQSRINADSTLAGSGVNVVVKYVTDHLEITSNRYGSASKVEITTNTTTGLGLSVTAGTDGVDVAGTIGGVAATGSGRYLTGIGDGSGLSLEVLGGSTGARGNVTFSRGLADQLDAYLSNLLDSDGTLTTRTDGLNTAIDSINDQREVLARRLEAIEARYRSQFAALDILLSQMQSTSSYLSQQLDNLPGAKKS